MARLVDVLHWKAATAGRTEQGKPRAVRCRHNHRTADAALKCRVALQRSGFVFPVMAAARG